MGREDQGVGKSRARYQVIPRTLCFIKNGTDILLLKGGPHKRLWAGLYNGIGGHVERGEDVYSAALREIKEETALEVDRLWLCGVVHVDAGDPVLGILFFVFTALALEREFMPSEEGALAWVPVSDLPQTGTVEDLVTLLPRVLAMQPGDPPFFARYSYDQDNRLVISYAAGSAVPGGR